MRTVATTTRSVITDSQFNLEDGKGRIKKNDEGLPKVIQRII